MATPGLHRHTRAHKARHMGRQTSPTHRINPKTVKKKKKNPGWLSGSVVKCLLHTPDSLTLIPRSFRGRKLTLKVVF